MPEFEPGQPFGGIWCDLRWNYPPPDFTPKLPRNYPDITPTLPRNCPDIASKLPQK